MGDCMYLGSMEEQKTYNEGIHSEPSETGRESSKGVVSSSKAGGLNDSTYSSLYKVEENPLVNAQKKLAGGNAQVVKSNDEGGIDIMQDQLVDIMKIRFNGKL